MFRPGDTVIVAVSGGPDSVFLLHILDRLRYDLGIHIRVVHLNHQLRRAANSDQRFVHTLAKKLQLPFTTASVRIRKTKRKTSLEEIAREARFRFLMRTAQKYKADAIALGHTKDDLAETVLMRILRGTGLMGMRGILPKREIGGHIFLRPLLGITKQEILNFLAKENIRYRLDSTNTQTDFFRNKIRLRLLPVLEREYNNDIRHVLANLSQTISSDYDYLKKQGEQSARELFRSSKNKKQIQVALASLLKLPVALQRILIRLAIEKLAGNTRRMTFAHIQEIEELAANRPSGSRVHLPNRITVLKENRRLCFAVRT